MNAAALSCTSSRLESIAVVNGRVKADVFLRLRGATGVIVSDAINPTSADQRETFLGRVPSDLRDEAAGLLLELAEAVGAHRAKAKPADEAKSEDPFPQIEPWGAEVGGAELLEEIRATIERYTVLPPHASDVLALWVAHTYVFELSDFTPYILITSPTRECGKSTLLDVLNVLAWRAQVTGGITAAALYRRIARLKPTMLLDELDTRLRMDGAEALRGVLNNGFFREGKITICSGDEHEDRDFPVYCPKVLSGIGRVWDTVTSRSIPIRLARASKDELSKIERIRGDRIGQMTYPIRQRLRRWTNDVRDRLAVTDSVTPTELGARQSDVWRPLLAIADVAGGRWPADARAAALALHGVAEEEGDYGLLMLEDVRALFAATGTDTLHTSYIIQELAKREDRPWPEYKAGHAITPRGVASLLGRFGVKPKNVRSRGDVGKGYELDALLPMFAKYLSAPTPPDQSVTSVTPTTVTEVAHISAVDQYEIDEREAMASEGRL